MSIAPVVSLATQSLNPNLHFPLLDNRRYGLEPDIVRVGRTVFAPYVDHPLWVTDRSGRRRDAIHRKAAPLTRLGRLVQLTSDGLLLAWEEPRALLLGHPSPPSWQGYREFVQWTDWYTGAWQFQVPTSLP